MKKAVFAAAFLVAVALVAFLAGCNNTQQPTEQSTAGTSPTALGKGTKTGTCTYEYNLTAGQHIPVGTITVTNDATNLYVTYKATAEFWTFGTLHLWVGNDLTNVPSTPGNQQCPGGAPIPGQFPYISGEGGFPSSAGLTEYTFTIPFTSLNITDVTQVCGLPLYFVPHAEVNYDDGQGNTDEETAFGGNEPGNCNRWYFYDSYPICCDFGPPPTPTCKTAFAKGGWVFVTDKKANPENLPSLKLIRNRWGWAIKITADGDYTYDIWAGAGLNKTSNGTKVGTLNVSVSGGTVTVTYNLSGASMGELHIYAGDCPPTTTAPGQYGYTQYFDPKTDSHTATFSVSDGDDGCGGDGIWIIAHAVVCY